MPLSFVWVNLTQFWLKRTFSNGFAYRVLFIKSQPLSHLLLESLVVKSIQSKTHFWSIFGRLKGVGFYEFDEFWLWKWFWVYFYDYFGRIAIKVNYWPFLDSPNNRIKIHSVHITNPQVYSWTYSKKSCLFQGLGLTNSIFRYSIYCRSILFWSLEFFTWYEHSKILSKLRY